MSDRQLEPWGGEVHMPRWMRKVLRRPDLAADSPEAAHEKRKEQPSGVGARERRPRGRRPAHAALRGGPGQAPARRRPQAALAAAFLFDLLTLGYA